MNTAFGGQSTNDCTALAGHRHSNQSDLIYPNSLVPIIMCSDCETCGLLNHCKYKIIEEVVFGF